MRLKYYTQHMCLSSFNKLLLVVLLSSSYGCTTISDLSSQSPYVEWVGRQFVLTQDCYVFKVKEKPGTLYVGRNLYLMPSEVAPQFVDKHFSDITILGILRTGSQFTIVGCYEERDIGNVTKNFEATLDEKDDKFSAAVFNVKYLTDLTKRPPLFDEALTKLVPRSK
jgi:hypothetical protein